MAQPLGAPLRGCGTALVTVFGKSWGFHVTDVLGIRPDDRVAICCERNPEMVIGLLAIFKAGESYS